MKVLPLRFAKYGLTLHPEKTRLLSFRKPPPSRPRIGEKGGDRTAQVEASATFDFLGFTIHWGRSVVGTWAVKTRTAKDRFKRTLANISAWCKQHRHDPIKMQQVAINLKLRGHYAYFGRVGNKLRLWTLLHWVRRIWQKWLNRRSQRGLNWVKMRRLLLRYPLVGPSSPARIA